MGPNTGARGSTHSFAQTQPSSRLLDASLSGIQPARSVDVSALKRPAKMQHRQPHQELVPGCQVFNAGKDPVTHRGRATAALTTPAMPPASDLLEFATGPSSVGYFKAE